MLARFFSLAACTAVARSDSLETSYEMAHCDDMATSRTLARS